MAHNDDINCSSGRNWDHCTADKPLIITLLREVQSFSCIWCIWRWDHYRTGGDAIIILCEHGFLMARLVSEDKTLSLPEDSWPVSSVAKDGIISLPKNFRSPIWCKCIVHEEWECDSENVVRVACLRRKSGPDSLSVQGHMGSQTCRKKYQQRWKKFRQPIAIPINLAKVPHLRMKTPRISGALQFPAGRKCMDPSCLHHMGQRPAVQLNSVQMIESGANRVAFKSLSFGMICHIVINNRNNYAHFNDI